jgi:hypothetical protein
MASPPLLPLLLLALLVAPPAPCLATTTLPLYRHLPHVVGPQQHPLSRLAGASLARATHLKSSTKRGGGVAAAGRGGGTPATALYPHSYGGYAFTASLGTPAQQVPVLLDTGSQLTWVPCTSNYDCRDCSPPAAAAAAFHPRRSSSSRLVGCRDPSCRWVHTSTNNNCTAAAANNNVCPPYAVVYGSGSTAGLLIADTLRAPAGRGVKKGFVVGCSLVSVHQPPTGLAGFGRGAPSVPAQLGLDRFSYCLLSRRFDDDANVSGQLVLGDHPPPPRSSKGRAMRMQYVPFVKIKKKRSSPPSSADKPYSVYYYLALAGIAVGSKPVRLPERALVSGPRGGGGGAIIDSGTTFTYLDPTVFRPVAAAVIAAVGGRYNRSKQAEDGLGLRPCFALPSSSSKKSSMELPVLSLRFKGGAEMRLPLENYLVLAESSGSGAEEAICLAVVTDIANGPAVGGGGPAIILGSFQQQNYYVEYDLRKERLGFRRQQCASTK